jgi:hypothetical protein
MGLIDGSRYDLPDDVYRMTRSREGGKHNETATAAAQMTTPKFNK